MSRNFNSRQAFWILRGGDASDGASPVELFRTLASGQKANPVRIEEAALRLDAHVHTSYSKTISEGYRRLCLKESYSSPQDVYRRAKTNGMDLVAVTDHDTIDGALEIAHHPDVIVGCEVTAFFADDGVPVHLGVLDITEEQHREIEELRHNVRELMPYLRTEGIFTTLNHVASRVSGPITAKHIFALMPWVDGIETLNGARPSSQNRTATALAKAFGKSPVGGSDSHTLSRIGRTYVEADATDRAGFLDAVRQGRARVGGDHCSCLTLSSDIVRIAASFIRDGFARFLKNPFDSRNRALALMALPGIPLMALSLVGACVYLMMEERFNRSLLFDLVARPRSSVFAHDEQPVIRVVSQF
jgi:predicted metal-dependent phosphoesterase TrpH